MRKLRFFLNNEQRETSNEPRVTSHEKTLPLPPQQNSMQSKLTITLVGLLLCQLTHALDLTLHLNKDSQTVSDLEVYFCAFNESSEFSPKNLNLNADADEEINLEIFNNDDLPHTFTIDGLVDEEIAAGESASVSFTISEEGTYRYYSSYSYGMKTGASGILLIGYTDIPQFYWNLFDCEHTLSQELAENTTSEIPSDYQPELFFINGAHFPNTLEDPETYIEIELGDEIIISILNSGNMEHVLHFHGFHVEVLQSEILDHYTGWIKDTLPFKCGEMMTVKLTADQPGIYPVHDHNLIAVTNVGFYPGGMLTQINVTE